MFSSRIEDGLNFTITENGKQENWVTNASPEVLVDAFDEAETLDELVEEVRGKGFKINVLQPCIALNFDQK